MLFYTFYVRGSLRQDESKDPAFTVRARRLAPPFMVVFFFSVTILAFDWISGLEPEWYSDMFGVYLFAGSFIAGIAAMVLGVLSLKSRGRLPEVQTKHVYNLGSLGLAFTVFFAYIGFAQYMLIWYANLPEEVIWFKHRIEGAWQPVALLLPCFTSSCRSFCSSGRWGRSIPLPCVWPHFRSCWGISSTCTGSFFPCLGPSRFSVGPSWPWRASSSALAFYKSVAPWATALTCP